MPAININENRKASTYCYKLCNISKSPIPSYPIVSYQNRLNHKVANITKCRGSEILISNSQFQYVTTSTDEREDF
uniref:Uncharacterized protein n=1 Tax=Rhizophora mucronata TaxID=61149 RepID=A0A2P2N598_RHIMU